MKDVAVLDGYTTSNCLYFRELDNISPNASTEILRKDTALFLYSQEEFLYCKLHFTACSHFLNYADFKKYKT